MATIRITDAELLEIIDVDSTITNYTPFILAASLMVDNNLVDSGLNDETLKEIERWLAAHFIAIRDPRLSAEKAGSVSVDYQHKLGLNLQSSMYGQQALALDYTGTLYRLSEGDSVPTPIIEQVGGHGDRRYS